VKSVSDSTRDKDRLVRRNPLLRPLSDPDWRWLWASYQMNGWTDILQHGLSREDFQERILTIVGGHDLDWIAEVHTDGGLRPVALFVADYRFGGYAVEPHVRWFPWASPRNKLEIGVKFMMEVGKMTKVFIYPPNSDGKLWERVWRYKVLKKGCKISDCYGKGEDAVMYYTPGPF
jgi:hypothetical protein